MPRGRYNLRHSGGKKVGSYNLLHSKGKGVGLKTMQRLYGGPKQAGKYNRNHEHGELSIRSLSPRNASPLARNAPRVGYIPKNQVQGGRQGIDQSARTASLVQKLAARRAAAQPGTTTRVPVPGTTPEPALRSDTYRTPRPVPRGMPQGVRGSVEPQMKRPRARRKITAAMRGPAVTTHPYRR